MDRHDDHDCDVHDDDGGGHAGRQEHPPGPTSPRGLVGPVHEASPALR